MALFFSRFFTQRWEWQHLNKPLKSPFKEALGAFSPCQAGAGEVRYGHGQVAPAPLK